MRMIGVLFGLMGCSGDHLFIEKTDYEGDSPGECSDNADNDRDGLFDCADSDCSGAAECTPEDTVPEENVDTETVTQSDSDTETDTMTDTASTETTTDTVTETETDHDLPMITWAVTFGGLESDNGKAVHPTPDGGYITAGSTSSFGTGLQDAWLIKVDAYGTEEWRQTYGSAADDWIDDLQLTSDGGYILTGGTRIHGHVDAWLIKVDANGNEQWRRIYGGHEWDDSKSVQQTTDGGYILAGYTRSYGNGSYDMWLIKVDANGDEQWSQTYGDNYADDAYSIQPTTDGMFIVAGRWNGLPSGSLGNASTTLLKIDTTGVVQWQRFFDYPAEESCYSVVQTTDGGYFLSGVSTSLGVGYDGYVIKTDADGNEQWSTSFDEGEFDFLVAGKQTHDAGFIVIGNKGDNDRDLWLIKMSANGTVDWQHTFGDTGLGDFGLDVQPTADGGYIITGGTFSYGNGNSDLWLIKTDADGNY